ncbi:VOC family protein [Algoriphagus sp. oki45]|uniref:bleomycin resistance protein n=1 Tax=Algoriphagus sp. oki45 TaxID=3067294 RepID=UPI0027EC3C58|nr:VOC family protein [Algoriphagus sp. oki45]
MLAEIHPKLPMRDKAKTEKFYLDLLGFKLLGSTSFPEYLMVKKDKIELHFFLFPGLNPLENYGQVYIRVENIEKVYQDFLERKVPFHPNGPLQSKPWGQIEFSILDPDHNLLTFGQSL